MKIKKDLLVIIVVTIFISLVTIFFFIYTYGFIKIFQQITRFFLILILSYFLYIEKRWAKWVFTILSYIGGFAGIISIFNSFSLEYLSSEMIGLLLMSSFYISAATYIAFVRKWNKSIKQ